MNKDHNCECPKNLPRGKTYEPCKQHQPEAKECGMCKLEDPKRANYNYGHTCQPKIDHIIDVNEMVQLGEEVGGPAPKVSNSSKYPKYILNICKCVIPTKEDLLYRCVSCGGSRKMFNTPQKTGKFITWDEFDIDWPNLDPFNNEQCQLMAETIKNVVSSINAAQDSNGMYHLEIRLKSKFPSRKKKT